SMEQGRRAARHALGLETPERFGIIPTGIYAVPEMSMVGLTEPQVTEAHGGAMIGRASFSEVARGLIANIPDGFLKLIADPEGRRV
ncbi:MAG: Si-specific NAD(P)(+) transhydrogenase, partial [Myxococcota bacterium]